MASFLHTLNPHPSHQPSLSFSTWQRPNNVLLSPLPGQFVLSSGTDVRLWPCDRDPHPLTVAFQPALIWCVVDIWGRGLCLFSLPLSLASVQQNTHFQEVFGAPSTNLYSRMVTWLVNSIEMKDFYYVSCMYVYQTLSSGLVKGFSFFKCNVLRSKRFFCVLIHFFNLTKSRFGLKMS